MIKFLFNFLTAVFVTASSTLFAADILLSVVEKDAENNSPRLQSLKLEQKAAEERSSSQKAQLYPKLFLDGSYRYATEVPEIALPIANFKPVQFGDNTNYSFGPSVTWTAWDSGGLSNAFKSLAAAAEAKKLETEAARRQVVLYARKAYFQVSLSAEQVMMYSDALKLADAQYEDIKLNVRAGTKSRADELKAHQEVLSRMKQLRQAQCDMAAALDDLSSITGAVYEASKPESSDALLTKFEAYARSALNEKHPSLELLLISSESSGYAAKSAGSGHWPKLQLSARSSLDYPNGNKLESFNQNAVAAAFNWSLFEAGAVKNRVNESESLRSAGLERRRQLLSDLRRDWKKTVEQLSNLEEQKDLNQVSVNETEELKNIIYKAYKAGSVSFLEVENANFKALEAKINSAGTKVQLLMNLAVIADLSE